MQLEDFLSYLVHERRLSLLTETAYRADLKHFIQHISVHFGIDDVTVVTGREARAWLASMVEAGLEATTIRRRWSAVSSYYRYLIERGHVRIHPLEGLQLPKKAQRLPKHLRLGQLQDLLDILPPMEVADYGASRDRTIILLFILSGVRRQELIDLDLSDVRLQEGVLRVLGKRQKERLVPMSDHLKTELKIYMERRRMVDGDRALFITDRGKRLYPKYVYNLVMRYTAAIPGVVGLSPHKLRHTYATLLLDLGADINAIKSLLGHANLSATQIYTHTSIEQIKAAYKDAHPKARD